MDDLQAMAVFAAVVQQGSMSGAARQLGMTPSAVSQRVRALEGAHRVTLLHRTTRRLTLTEVGQRVFAHCESLLRSADSAPRGSRARATDGAAPWPQAQPAVRRPPDQPSGGAH